MSLGFTCPYQKSPVSDYWTGASVIPCSLFEKLVDRVRCYGSLHIKNILEEKSCLYVLNIKKFPTQISSTGIPITILMMKWQYLLARIFTHGEC